ncbi:MAG TPA: tetratricopeptide repeat protein [bacterium]|jgi:tetratricopeptide (TPR) repeat protein|nr:tetratricopeptide repeat protein [bacterium]
MKKAKTLFILMGMVLLMPVFLWADSKVSPEGDYKKGLDLYGQGRYEDALVRFQLAIDENWTFWQSYQMVGYCYFELREKESALRAFEQSLKINPQNPKLAKVYNDLKSGSLDIPVRPVDNEPLPIGTPVYIQTYYTYNHQ